MGKTARWLKGLLGGKKAESPSPTANVKDGKPVKEKKRWGFVRSFRDKDLTAVPQVNGDGCRGSYREGSSVLFVDGVDPNKHAIAVAAATAAVAEAAVAAAQAAAAVVRLTSSGRCLTPFGGRNVGRQEDWAAVKIQAAFRGYLARRALLALKGLVKLQALVRGHIVRKRMAEKLRCLQALVRVQARARAGRAHISPRQPNSRHSLPHHFGPATPKNFEHPIHANSIKRDRWSSTLCRNGLKPNNRDISNLDKAHLGSNRLGHWMDERSWQHHQETSIRTGRVDDEKSDKILEVDTGEPHLNPTRRSNVFQSSQQALDFDRNSHSFTTLYSLSRDPTTSQLLVPSPSSGEVQHMSNLRDEDDDASFGTADNSPQFYSASSRPGSARRGPFTPTRSECSRSFFSGYSDYPNYMANTESSRAKVRSQSAPRQRPEFEKSGSTKRLSVHGFRDTKLSAQSPLALHAKFSNKAYPGSGRLDRFGMPIPGDTISFNGVYHNIY